MSAAPKRRFRIWSKCFLLVGVISASLVWLFRQPNRPPAPIVSVNFVRTNVFATEIPAISIELSNRMSFNVDYWIIRGVGGNYFRYGAKSLKAHSQRREFVLQPTEGLKMFVSYGRQLKPLEESILNKLPWPRRRYPFQPSSSTPIYEVPKTEKFPNWTGVGDE